MKIPGRFALGVGVDPGLGQMDDESFRLLAGFEPIADPADRMAVTLPVALPSDLGTRGPLLIAGIERAERDDQSIVVVEIRHEPI